MPNVGDENDNSQTLDHLLEGITELSLNVAVLRREVAARPTRWEITHRRRVSFVFVFVLLGTVLGLSDLNTSYCGPGQRAEKSLAVLLGGERDPAVIANAGHPITSPACDILVPYHGHSGTGYPTVYSWLGILWYSMLAAGGVLWARGPRQQVEVKHNRRKGDLDDPTD